ncbi:MAG: phytoene desaturase family protein [Brevinema sp.]
MKYDIVVIGAGLGGLTSAAMLAKKGKKVLVLEQHNIPGGCATVFKRKGVTFEVGLHEMDLGLEHRDTKHVIFRKLGLDKTLPLVHLPEFFRLKTESLDYRMPEGIENAKAYLKEQFPHEKKGIDSFFRDMNYTTYPIRRLPCDLDPISFFFFPITSFPSFVKSYFEQATVGQKMDKYFTDNRIKTLVNANLAYFSNEPYDLGWFYYSAAQYSYFNSGVFIKGGSQTLSNQLVDVITANGGEVRLLADVKKLEMKGNKATGVTYQDRKSKEMITVATDTIIANCAPHCIFNGNMVPTDIQEPNLSKLEIESSLYTIYVIFKKKISELYPGNAYSTFLFDDKVLTGSSFSEFGKSMKEDLEHRGFVFVDYSAVDSGLVPEGDERSFGVLCTATTMSEWEHLSPEAYKAKKEEVMENAFQRLEKFYPGIREQIEYAEMSTPKSAQHYLRTPGGTAYGFKQKAYLKGSRLPRKSKAIKNMYYASAWGFPGGGFTGAIISGYMTAIEYIMPMKVRMFIGVVLCTISGTLIGTASHWLPALLAKFF